MESRTTYSVVNIEVHAVDLVRQDVEVLVEFLREVNLTGNQSSHSGRKALW